MDDYSFGVTIGALLSMVIFALLTTFLFMPLAEQVGYEKGQIDAANGIQKYCLVEQDNGETEWELCNER